MVRGVPLPRGGEHAVTALMDDAERRQNAERADSLRGATVLSNGGDEDIVFVATQRLVLRHGLGREPRGWVLTNINLKGAIWCTKWSRDTITMETDQPGISMRLKVM